MKQGKGDEGKAAQETDLVIMPKKPADAVRAIILGSLVILLCSWPFALGLADSSKSYAYYYRLKASYLHGSERIDFNIVAGCGARITNSQANGRSFDAIRYPSVYGKPTHDGGAVLQLVTAACKGETTANKEAPADLLPGAIWYKDKNDLSLGIGYFTEDAYENPQSQLKFLGATIEAADEKDWTSFQSILAQNLIDARALITTPPWPSEASVRANMWNKKKLFQWTLNTLSCWAVARYQTTDPGLRAVIDRYRPEGNPRFWSPGYPTLRTVFKETGLFTTVRFDGALYRDYGAFGSQPGGFPTRAKGGRLLTSPEPNPLPPEIYPLRADDGVPWARPQVTEADVIYRDVDFDAGANRGFAYCYSFYIGRGALERLLLPNYRVSHVITRIDGQPILVTGEPGGSPERSPDFFFERDEYLYHPVVVGLY
jgi:hypothetical protein